MAATLGVSVPCNKTTPILLKWRQMLQKAWKNVMRQIDITLRHHERQDYDAIYKQVQRTTSRDPVHVANWVPGKGDVRGLKAVTLTKHEAGVHLIKLYTDLQKFDIILEDVARGDGENLTLKHMMVSTRHFLRQLQREVETALMCLHMAVPASRLTTEDMIQQKSSDPTSTVPRGRSVLRRYRNYLRQWVKLWSHGVERRRRMPRKCCV